MLFVWREHDPVWRKIAWSANKRILVADFDLNLMGLVLCTVQGVCYKAQFQKTRTLTSTGVQSTNATAGEKHFFVSTKKKFRVDNTEPLLSVGNI